MTSPISNFNINFNVKYLSHSQKKAEKPNECYASVNISVVIHENDRHNQLMKLFDFNSIRPNATRRELNLMAER